VDDNCGIIETREDFDRYAWPEITGDVAAYLLKAQAQIPDGMKMVYLTPAGILENVMWLMGYVPFSYALMDDEQLVWDLFERIGENHLVIMRGCLESCDMSKLGAVAMGDDMGFSTGTMLSPKLMRKFVFPWQKKVVELAHHYDLPFILHSCGNLNAIMGDLIHDVEIDAKHSFEDKIMPVSEACRLYKRDIAILGGVDMDFLCREGEIELVSGVERIIENCAPGGGYALGTGNSLADYVPFRSYTSMLETGDRYGRYPLHVIRQSVAPLSQPLDDSCFHSCQYMDWEENV